MLWNILDKVFIAKKCTQCKTSHTLEKPNYQIIKILENCFQNMNCFPWIKLISVLIYLKYYYCNNLELPCLFRYLCQISPSSTEKPLFNTIFVMFYIRFRTFSTPCDHTSYLLDIPSYMTNQSNQIYCQAKYKSKYLLCLSL